MTSVHEIWCAWHIRSVRNVRVYDVDPGDFHLLDTIPEEWVRPSMRLRGLSERKLRAEQLKNHWTNEQLVEHVRGDHDGPDERGDPGGPEDYDNEIFHNLVEFQGCSDEVHKFVPVWRLKEIARWNQLEEVLAPLKGRYDPGEEEPHTPSET